MSLAAAEVPPKQDPLPEKPSRNVKSAPPTRSHRSGEEKDTGRLSSQADSGTPVLHKSNGVHREGNGAKAATDAVDTRPQSSPPAAAPAGEEERPKKKKKKTSEMSPEKHRGEYPLDDVTNSKVENSHDAHTEEMTKRRKKKTEKEADVEHYPTEDLTSRADNSEIPSEDAHRKRKKKKKSDAEETNNREEKNGAPAEKLEVENGRKEGEVVPSSDSKKKRSKPDEESHVERLDTGDKSPDPESQQDEQRRKKKRKKKTTNGDSINVSEYNDTDEEERLAIALHKQKLNDEATTATEASSKRNSQLLVSEKASPTETRRSSKVPESTYVSEAPPQRRPGTNTPLPIENSSGGEFTSREPNHSASPEKKSSDSPIQLVPEEPDQSIVVDMEGSGVAHSDTRRVLNKIRPREESVEMREFSPRDAEASHFVEDNHSVQVVPPNADISQIQQEADRYYGETLYASEEGVYTDSDSSSSSSSDRGPRDPVKQPFASCCVDRTDPDSWMDNAPRRHGMQRPLHLLQIIAGVIKFLGMLFFWSSVFPGYILLYLDGHHDCLAELIVFSVLIFIGMMSLGTGWAIVTFRENGDYSKTGDLCTYCRRRTKDDSKHCKACNKCVEGFDHHCKWLNMCVGRRNYRGFLCYVISAVTTMTLAMISGIVILAKWWKQLEAHNVYFRVGPILLCAVMLIGLPAIVHLLGFHIMLNIKGLTTYEYILQKRERQSQTPFGKQGNAIAKEKKKKKKKKKSNQNDGQEGNQVELE